MIVTRARFGADLENAFGDSEDQDVWSLDFTPFPISHTPTTRGAKGPDPEPEPVEIVPAERYTPIETLTPAARTPAASPSPAPAPKRAVSPWLVGGAVAVLAGGAYLLSRRAA